MTRGDAAEEIVAKLREVRGVCTENSNPDVMMVKPAEDRV